VKEQNIEGTVASRIVWENLEEWVRGRIQTFVQELLQEEVTELLGRKKSERKAVIDQEVGYRNGHGKERNLSLNCGTIVVRRPRVRGLEQRFVSRVLPVFKRRTKAFSDLLPELYLHGLAEGDFDLALRGFLGEDAPLSASTVARLKEGWHSQLAVWKTRRLDEYEVVYLWVDGIYVKAGLESEKAALLVAIAGLSDGRKILVALEPGHRESTESWSRLLRDLKSRGMKSPQLTIGDGHLGIWAALRNVYPESEEQRCWNHRIVNVLDQLPKKKQGEAKLLLKEIPYAETAAKAVALKTTFQDWCRQNGQDKAGVLLEHDWERMISFYRFPKEHWIHLRTSNIIESPFAALRLRTSAAKRFKKVANATAVIWKMLMIAETRFRKLNAPELLKEVYLGVKFEDGLRVNQQNWKKAA